MKGLDLLEGDASAKWLAEGLPNLGRAEANMEALPEQRVHDRIETWTTASVRTLSWVTKRIHSNDGRVGFIRHRFPDQLADRCERFLDLDDGGNQLATDPWEGLVREVVSGDGLHRLK